MRIGFISSVALAALLLETSAFSQAWKSCVPNSMGPGGCESMGPGGGQSMGPGGGQSMGPGGGQSMGPGGGLSMGPGGGQSMGPGGGQSMGPGGGQSITRDRNFGLNPDTMLPYTCSEGGPC